MNDRWGNQIVSIFEDDNRTQLNNYGYRTYFTGLDDDARDAKGRYQIAKTEADRQITNVSHLSATFLSQANNKWKVAFSAPIIVDKEVIGIVAVTVVLGDFIDFDNDNDPNQYVMMVDGRTGQHTGSILEHPLLDQLEAETGVIPKAFSQKRISLEHALETTDGSDFVDPMGDEPEGSDYQRKTIAAAAGVKLRRKPVTTQEQTEMVPITGDEGLFSIVTGLKVLAVEDYASVINPVTKLSQRLAALLGIALLSLLALSLAMWWLVTRTINQGSTNAGRISATVGKNTWSPDEETLCYDEHNEL